jgi:thymidylate kinase
MLVDELVSLGIQSRYVYGRFLPKVMAPVFKIISTLAYNVEDSRNPQDTRLPNQRRLLSNPVISKIFIVGVLFDQILQMLIKVYLPSIFRKEVVVCDRYFHDTALIDIAIPCDLSYNNTIQFIKRYLPLFPKTRIVFLVTVPPKIGFQRKNDITSLTTLERLSDTYLSMAMHFGATTIDGTKNLSELKSVVLNYLELSGISLNERSER